MRRLSGCGRPVPRQRRGTRVPVARPLTAGGDESGEKAKRESRCWISAGGFRRDRGTDRACTSLTTEDGATPKSRESGEGHAGLRHPVVHPRRRFEVLVGTRSSCRFFFFPPPSPSPFLVSSFTLPFLGGEGANLSVPLFSP